MNAMGNQLFDNVPKTDPLAFGIPNDIDYKKVSNFLELDKNALSKIGNISKQSVRTDEKIPQALKDRLLEIAVVCSLVAEYFEGDPKKTAMWFKTANPMLGDITPQNMVRLGRSNKLIKFIMEAREANGKEGPQSNK